MKDKGLPPSLIKSLSDAVRSYPSIKSLYLFGATTVRKESEFYFPDAIKLDEPASYEVFVLIVSETPIGDPLKFREAIQAQMKEEVKVFTIHYTCEDFEMEMDRDTFLRQILLPDNLIWSDIEWEFPDFTGKRHLEHLIEEWEFRMGKAGFFHEKAALSGWEKDDIAVMELVSQAVLQACAGLVWIHLNWKPRNFDLDLGLNLCKSFSTIPEILLPDATFRSQKMYHFLCQSRKHLLFNTESLLTQDEIDHATFSAEKFIREVNTFGVEIIRARGEKNYQTLIHLDLFEPVNTQEDK